jgi:DNA polymerase-3 subunit epsilon
LLAFLDGAELVIHNAGFDVGFINAELRPAGAAPHAGRTVGQRDRHLAMAREMFPGKSNSLDALCKRLEVDNSGRSLHGALLDAGLLAEVYIRMTRGQDTLVIAHESGGALGAGDLPAVDLSTFELALVEPTAEELAAHEAVLAELDKASGGKSGVA